MGVDFTSAHEQLQAAGVLLHLSTHSVGQRQDCFPALPTSREGCIQGDGGGDDATALQLPHMAKRHRPSRRHCIGVVQCADRGIEAQDVLPPPKSS